MIREEAEAGLTAEDLIEADDIDLSVFDSLAAPSLRTVPAALHASQASRTTKTASPSTPKPPRAARIAQLIEESRTLVDRVLLSIPDSRVTARRYLSDRLWTAPRAEEFQEILKMVEEEHSTGITAESGRRAIALRCVAETILREFWEASPSDPASKSPSSSPMRAVP